MACCIIAAYLWALVKGQVRHRLAWWGLVEPLPWDDRGTVWQARAARRASPPA